MTMLETVVVPENVTDVSAVQDPFFMHQLGSESTCDCCKLRGGVTVNNF